MPVREFQVPYIIALETENGKTLSSVVRKVTLVLSIFIVKRHESVLPHLQRIWGISKCTHKTFLYLIKRTTRGQKDFSARTTLGARIGSQILKKQTTISGL